MFKRIYLIITFLFLLSLPSLGQQFLPDIVLTSPNGIWTDSRTFNTLQDAITAIGANERDLYIARPETVNALTIPSNIRLKFLKNGAINNAGLLTINTRHIEAADTQIFTGAGTINFANGTTVRSAWFGTINKAITDTANDNVTLIISKQEAITVSVAAGDNVRFKWEDANNKLTANAGVVLSNIRSIEAPDVQLFVGAGDFDFYDGVTLRLPWFSSLRSALTWIENENLTLIIPKGTWPVDVDIASNNNTTIKVEQGGIIDIDNGVTLTINGHYDAGLYTTFTLTGTGIPSFGIKNHSVKPEWFGAIGDGLTDCYAAIVAACNSVYNPAAPALGNVIELQPNNTYITSLPIKHKASFICKGSQGSAVIKASAGFVGSCVIDGYMSAGVYYTGLQISNITISANNINGTACFASTGAATDVGRGNTRTKFSNVIFKDTSNAAAINGANTSAGYTVPGGVLTGANFDHCFIEQADILLIAGVGQDDVSFTNGCRLHINKNTTSVPISLNGCGQIAFKDFYLYIGSDVIESVVGTGVYAPIQNYSYTATFENGFIEASSVVNVTHLVTNNSVVCDLTMNNIYTNLNATNLPNLAALVRVIVWHPSWVAARSPRITMNNWKAYAAYATTKAIEVYGHTGATSDYATLYINGVDSIAEPIVLFTGTAGVKPGVLVIGNAANKFYNHMFYPGLTNAIPYGQVNYNSQNGLYTYTVQALSASAVTPVTATCTLPAEGEWVVHVTARYDSSLGNQAVGTWSVGYLSSPANDLLYAEQIGTTQLSAGGAPTTLTLTAPSVAGVMTAECGFGGGGSHIVTFIFKCRRLSNYLYYGE